jgi:hypothetical protein
MAKKLLNYCDSAHLETFDLYFIVHVFLTGVIKNLQMAIIQTEKFTDCINN